jgi:hypothetical protein
VHGQAALCWLAAKPHHLPLNGEAAGQPLAWARSYLSLCFSKSRCILFSMLLAEEFFAKN